MLYKCIILYLCNVQTNGDDKNAESGDSDPTTDNDRGASALDDTRNILCANCDDSMLPAVDNTTTAPPPPPPPPTVVSPGAAAPELCPESPGSSKLVHSEDTASSQHTEKDVSPIYDNELSTNDSVNQCNRDKVKPSSPLTLVTPALNSVTDNLRYSGTNKEMQNSPKSNCSSDSEQNNISNVNISVKSVELEMLPQQSVTKEIVKLNNVIHNNNDKKSIENESIPLLVQNMSTSPSSNEQPAILNGFKSADIENKKNCLSPSTPSTAATNTNYGSESQACELTILESKTLEEKIISSATEASEEEAQFPSKAEEDETASCDDNKACLLDDDEDDLLQLSLTPHLHALLLASMTHRRTSNSCCPHLFERAADTWWNPK